LAFTRLRINGLSLFQRSFNAMKKRFWLWERDGIFYLDDAVTRKKISLHTRERREAERIRDARNEAEARPVLSVQLAKAYLSAHDSQIAMRTWQDVINRFCSLGKPQTQAHRRLVATRKPQCFLRDMKVIETSADDLMKILKGGGVMTNTYVRCLHNLAVGLGWLPSAENVAKGRNQAKARRHGGGA
jgi:hypothetical protein